MDIFSNFLVAGMNKKVPTKYGHKRYINFDNAASTPPFNAVLHRLTEDAEWYSSVHRGTGYKSKYTTEKYEQARTIIAEFVKADLAEDVVIFTKNTTDSVNKLVHYLPFLPGDTVVYTRMEHHSNELPWQNHPHHCIGLNNGCINMDEMEFYLRKNKGKVKLVAVTGASNVTGNIPPVHTIAEIAHEFGAKILVDCAQLAAHRPIQMLEKGDPRHLDFLAFSGHKMYAPFGSGVLIGPRELFSKGVPSQVGGGTLRGLLSDGIIWSNPPENEEAGSPNVLGALAMAESCKVLAEIGWNYLISHEQKLIKYALYQMQKIPKVTIFNENPQNRVGVISFQIEGISHQETAALLANNYGIGVRNGCFCARRYVLELLGEDLTKMDKIWQNQPEKLPGLVRASFGCYNQIQEIDILCEAIEEIIKEKRA